MDGTKHSIASNREDATRYFKVTHPFHPWFKKKFELIVCQKVWGEDRVYFYKEKEKRISLPVSWTDVLGPEPFLVTSAGRSYFRVKDLLQLSDLIRSTFPADKKRKV